MPHEYFEFRWTHCFKQDFREDGFSLPCLSCGSRVRKISQVPRLYPCDANRGPSGDAVVYVSPTKEPPYARIHSAVGVDPEVPGDDVA